MFVVDAQSACMTPYNRVVLLVGGTAILASLTIAAVFVLTNASGAALHADRVAAGVMQALGDELLVEVRDQQDALDDYIMSGETAALARYREAVAGEAQHAADFTAMSAGLAGVATALASVDAENDAWRATIADPAIAAMQSGSSTATTEATQIRVQDQETSHIVSRQLLLEIDSAAAELDARSDALNQFRIEATGLGIAVELVAACLSLWFVRRYGQSVSRDARRRAQASAERIEIIASLRAVRIQPTPEATAAVFAEALLRLPGVDVAGVFECTPDGLRALATAGLPGFPIRTGDVVPERHARYLRDRSGHGPWAERVVRPADPDPYDDSIAALGIRSRAFAPIRVGDEMVGLIGLSTTDEDHTRHLIEDLPAVGEFASVAEAILAPELIARRDRATEQRRIAAVIAAAAFRPVFQPVVELATGVTVGFEALTRFDDGSRPDLVFAAAVACGMGIELEIVTLEAALVDARRIPPDAWLSLNVSPALLAKGGSTLAELLAATRRPVVLEVTEHEVIDAYAPLREALALLGPRVRLAIDDAGAGVANFNHLVELRPNYVKIDAGLVRGVDTDPSRRAVVVGLIHFAAEAGCEIIAEGIETEAERAMVAELGVTLGQGYLLARPAPADTWNIDSRHVGMDEVRFNRPAPKSPSRGASRALPLLGSLSPNVH